MTPCFVPQFQSHPVIPPSVHPLVPWRLCSSLSAFQHSLAALLFSDSLKSLKCLNIPLWNKGNSTAETQCTCKCKISFLWDRFHFFLTFSSASILLFSISVSVSLCCCLPIHRFKDKAATWQHPLCSSIKSFCSGSHQAFSYIEKCDWLIHLCQHRREDYVNSEKQKQETDCRWPVIWRSYSKQYILV